MVTVELALGADDKLHNEKEVGNKKKRCQVSHGRVCNIDCIQMQTFKDTKEVWVRRVIIKLREIV